MGAARKGWGLSAALVAAVVVLGLQSIRVLIPMLYEVRERSSAIDAVALAAVVFLAPLLAPVLRRILGAMAVLVAIASAALSRVGMQLWHPIPLWLASLAVAGGLLAWTFLLGARETRHGGVFVCGLLIGLSVDAAIHAAFGTWDPAWQTGAWPLVLASAIAAAAIVL
ncbi:MAG TPA: hypothetical protein VFA25_05015, partial [Actinomycetota bacterium]|nr:hypothetical protein [Actinomycetota bacterium]